MPLPFMLFVDAPYSFNPLESMSVQFFHALWVAFLAHDTAIFTFFSKVIVQLGFFFSGSTGGNRSMSYSLCIGCVTTCERSLFQFFLCDQEPELRHNSVNLLESLLLNSPEKAVSLRKSWLNPRRDPHVFDKPFLTYPASLLLVLIPWLVEIIVAMSLSIWNMDQLTVAILT